MNAAASNAVPNAKIIPFPDPAAWNLKKASAAKARVPAAAGQTFLRREAKYLLDREGYESVKALLDAHLIPDTYKTSSVRNIYFDTPDFRLIRKSMEKPCYKEKIRVRSYKAVTHDELVFLELKRKVTGTVYKRRILVPEKEAMDFLVNGTPFAHDGQIQRELEYFRDFYKVLEPKFYLTYDRTAYVAADDPGIRVTFDRNILWRSCDMSLAASPGGKPLLREDELLMEIKLTSGMPMWLVDILNKSGAKKVSFSKCGRAYEQYFVNARPS